MEKPREDTCGCGGSGKYVTSPSLRLLIEMLDRAEQKKKAEEAKKEEKATAS